MDVLEQKEKRIGDFLSSEMLPGNREKLAEFNEEYKENGISAHTRYTYVTYLYALDRYARKPFEDLTKKDVIGFLKSLDVGEGTRIIVKQRLKTFFKWLNGGETYPDCVKWIKIKSKQPEKIDAKNVLTHDDIKTLISQCDNSKDKALFSLLYESAARVREFTNLKIKDYRKNHEPTAWLRIKGKGKKVREIMIINSIPYMARWLDDHPDKDNPEAYLFVNSKGKKLTRGGVVFKCLKYADRAAITKPVNPHWFRHSRLTEVAQIYNESELREFAGWTRTSQMPARYIHESREIMAAKLKKRAGLEVEEDIFEDKLKPKVCTYCGHTNEADNNFCGKCSNPLDTKTAVQVERVNRELSLRERLMNEIKEEVYKEIIAELKGGKV